MKAEDGYECFVDAPKLLTGQMADQIAEPLGVYGADLFYENASGFAFDLSLGPEGGRASTP